MTFLTNEIDINGLFKKKRYLYRLQPSEPRAGEEYTELFTDVSTDLQVTPR
jgi:hypothetical protein